MICYVDASVLLRVVFGEPDRLRSWRTIEPVASELVRVETLRVLDRARHTRALDEMVAAGRRGDAIDTLRRFTLAPVSASVLDRAGDPFPTQLGTLDAIHLATALELRSEFPDMVFATHDAELGVAAQAMGFRVDGI